MSHAHALPDPRLAVAVDEIGGLEVVTVVTDATIATVQLRGEMDLGNAELVTAVLDHQLAFGRRFVRLDLSHLSFLDCAGLRALVAGHNRFLAAQGTLVLTGIGPKIARLLRITQFDEALFIADSPDPADPVSASPSHLRLVPTQ